MSSLPQQHNPILGVQTVRAWFKAGCMMFGAGVWGLSLSVVGLWVLAEPMLPGFLAGLSEIERVLVGVGMMAGGQLIFLMFVAERVFARTPHVVTLASQWVLSLVGLVCFVLFVSARFFPGGA